MITILFIVIFVLLALYVDKRNKNVEGIRKIPGPPPKPFIGNVLDIGTNTVDTLINFKKFKKEYGSIIKFWIGSNLYILLSEPKYIGQLLMGNHSEKSKVYNLMIPFLGYGLVTSSGEKWKVDRRLLSPYFNNRMVDQSMPSLNKNANDLVENLKQFITANPVDVTEFISNCAFNIICNTAMGVDLPFKAAYQNATNWLHANAMNRHFSVFKHFDWFYQFTRDCKNEQEKLKILDSCTDLVIAERRKERQANIYNEKKAFLDAILDLSEQGDWFTDKDIQDQVKTFIMAGSDTVSATVNYGLFELAKHPDVQKKILEETNSVLGDDKNADLTFDNLTDLTYTDCVFKEIMRMFSPVPIIERELIKEVHFGEHVLPKGTAVILFFCGCNYSASNFHDPDKFIPERFLKENVENIPQHAFTPFGEGPRNCVGQKFGSAEAKLLLCKVIRNFRIEAVQPEHIPQLSMAIVMKSSNGFPIKLRVR